MVAARRRAWPATWINAPPMTSLSPAYAAPLTVLSGATLSASSEPVSSVDTAAKRDRDWPPTAVKAPAM